MTFARELLAFFRERGKLWIIPLVIVLLLFGLLLMLTETALGPFIYTLF